jgi:hypothetical protein
MLGALTSAADLAVVRQQVLSRFKDDDDEVADSETMRLLTIAEKILLSASYETDADRLAAQTILAECPLRDWCNFKTDLFARLQRAV